MPSVELHITGRVQGVGFRPFIARLAHTYNLTGWVRNDGSVVRIIAEGKADALAAFQKSITQQAPPAARPVIEKALAHTAAGYEVFTIKSSAADNTETHTAHLPLDLFTCPDCLAELFDPHNRRYQYPFINCTQCGPRYTLISHLPYDRPATSMKNFVMCAECLAEYQNPLDRRYHAQPNACPACGPQISWLTKGHTNQSNVLPLAVDALNNGKVIAIKGVGGFHLMCLATNANSVSRLRAMKARPDKPLAVLCSDNPQHPAFVEHFVQLSSDAYTLLTSVERPIVLATAKPNTGLAKNIYPNLNNLGVMLAYTPLHGLLMHEIDAPLVVTSANISGQPLCTSDDDVLALQADAVLTHNRDILFAADDSVYLARGLPVRLGRGHTPKTLTMPFELHQDTIALGADDKVTFALGQKNKMVLSPHLGSLSSPKSHARADQTLAHFKRLFKVQNPRFVVDHHPQYQQRHYLRKRNLPGGVEVQHHHAHASAIWFDAWLQGKLNEQQKIWVCTWDGTGFGLDNEFWGGDIFYGKPGAWQRKAALASFALPGGDQCIWQPWRVALAMCPSAIFTTVSPEQRAAVTTLLGNKNHCTMTTSAGRLLDACAALLGIETASYDAFAAMQLNDLTTDIQAQPIALPWQLDNHRLLRLQWQPLIQMLTEPHLTRGQKAATVFSSLASAIEDFIKSQMNAGDVIAFTGGVFQSDRLVERLSALSTTANLVFHQHFPANDAAIAVGQIIEIAGACHESKD